MADTTKEHSTPIICLTPEERRMLREAWENAKDKLSLIALQNDDELKHLQNVSNEVKTVKRMKEEEREREKTRPDLGKLFRNIFAMFVSDYDKYSGGKQNKV